MNTPPKYTPDGNRSKSFLLEPKHLQMLLVDSAIDPDVVAERGYQTVYAADELEGMDFAPYQQRLPAILVPVHLVNGDGVLYNLRPDNPRVRRQHRGKAKVVKYEWPSSVPMRIDAHPRVRPVLGDPAIPLFITEGVKKADALTSRGLHAVALPGVWNWRGKNKDGGKTVLADWDYIALNGRTVYIIFDADAGTKPNVRDALDRFTAVLTNRGADVKPIIMPGPEKGVDDFFAAGHTVEELLVLADVPLPDLKVVELTQGSILDLGHAEELAAIYRGRLLWNRTHKQWLRWTDTRWMETDADMVVTESMVALKEIYAGQFEHVSGKEALNALISKLKDSQQNQRVATALKTLRGFAEFQIAAHELDADPWMLNFDNGTLDLRTLELLDHDPDSLITRTIGCDYDPDATCPTWEQTIAYALPDPELRSYFQQALGYCLTGDTSQQAIFVAYGPAGSNGKSTLMEGFAEALGEDYAIYVDPVVFTVGQRDNMRMSTKAQMEGKRFIHSSEMNSSQRIDEEFLKAWSGGDSQEAKRLYADTYIYKPQGKIWIRTNERPQISGRGNSIWQRMKMVPFEAVIPESERRPQGEVFEAFRNEQAGILAWATRGLALLHTNRYRLVEPTKVAEAVREYKEATDLVKEFISERCEKDPNAFLPLAEFVRGYNRWASDLKGKAHSSRSMGEELRRLEYVVERGGKGVTCVYGLNWLPVMITTERD